MKINLKSFIKGAFIGGALLLVSVLASSLYKYDIDANGSSECDQAQNCNVIDSPSQEGEHNNDAVISYAVFKAGQSYIDVNPGNDQNINECYLVSISGSNISWKKLVDGDDCQDISHIQLWSEGQKDPDPTPTETPDPTPTDDPKPTPTDEPDPTPTPEDPIEPPVASCSQQTPPGDLTHYDYGWHQIIGEQGLREGSDDVYSLNGDYLQCFCSVDKSEGIETLWWKVGELTQEQIDQYKNLGWEYYEFGEQWNLGSYWYLVKNGDFNCSEPTPTPTQTPTPTPTPTEGEEPESRCSGLSASPTEGTAPLTVRFNGSGYDEIGDIQKYRFDFGDSSGGQTQVWTQDESEAYHRYEYEGTYFASLHVQDSRGNWRNGENDCKVEITVKGKPQVLGGSTVETLPETGLPITSASALVTLGAFGAYIYRRFKLL